MDKIESKSQVSEPSSLDQPVEDAVIKLSTQMLLGFAMVGEQYFGKFCDNSGKGGQPKAVCALGAINLIRTGCAWKCDKETRQLMMDGLNGDINIAMLNDIEKCSIPEIAAMLAEKGL